jgi:hypothetical protein
MAARPESNTDVIGYELPLLCGSVEIRDLYSPTKTTPNAEVVGFLKGSAGSKTLLHFLNTWITLLSKIMEQLEGCDDATKAFVRAMIKNKVDGYMTRYFQQQMVGDLPTTATDAVTTSRTYTKLLEVCNKIKDVLESSDLDAEQMNERILALLSTINEDSEWKSPYDSDRPDYKLWTEMTKNHLLHKFESSREMLCESPNSNLVFFSGKKSTSSMFPTKFVMSISLPPQSASSIRIHTTFLLDSIGLRWVQPLLMMWLETSISI